MLEPSPVVVFADVDGLLQDPSSTVLAHAAGAVRELREQLVSVVLCSLKTRAELELLQQELGLRDPFVSEGGAAAFVPPGYFGFAVPAARDVAGYAAIEFGRPYSDIVRLLHATAQRVRVNVAAFSDMTVEEVSSATGLPLLRARLATLREYAEPFTVSDRQPGARARLVNALESAGLTCVERGRFHYLGDTPGYQAAVGMLRKMFERAHGTVLTLGVADGLSDTAVLAGTDAQLLVHDDGEYGGAIDLGGWAEGLLDAAADLRQRKAGARRRTKLLKISQ